ncbi:MAG TPA: 2OG-Fe(II) oxygenase [Gammaproteobacteria bacterium]|nr:2OG-Fe(II) oxygenase [Gammaproteobacteria bacterium]
MNTINYQSFSAKEIEKTPYYWGLQNNLIQVDIQPLLVNQFPKEGFTKTSRLEGDGKHYQFEVLNLIQSNEICDSLYHLSPTWQNFIKELASSAYINNLAKYIQRDLDGLRLDIGLFRFNENDWVDIHIDRKDKILTQLFYFNDYWQEDWGGDLYILSEANLKSVLAKVKPLVSHSATIVRTDNAWHYVSPISNKAEVPRLSLQLEIIAH